MNYTCGQEATWLLTAATRATSPCLIVHTGHHGEAQSCTNPCLAPARSAAEANMVLRVGAQPQHICGVLLAGMFPQLSYFRFLSDSSSLDKRPSLPTVKTWNTGQTLWQNQLPNCVAVQLRAAVGKAAKTSLNDRKNPLCHGERATLPSAMLKRYQLLKYSPAE